MIAHLAGGVKEHQVLVADEGRQLWVRDEAVEVVEAVRRLRRLVG